MPPEQTVVRTRARGATRRFHHIRPLDGVRGLAAIAVLLHHGVSVTARAGNVTLHWPFVRFIADYLFLGVDLFFVLSGYLITTLLLLARRQPSFYHDFYWKRVFRILPALLLVLVLLRLIFSAPWSGILIALLFVANFAFLLQLPAVGPFWSLAIEEQFYLLWPAVVHRTRPRVIRSVLLVLIAAPILLRILSGITGRGNSLYTPLHCDGLAWGALLALLCYTARIPFRSSNDHRVWRNYGRWMFFGGILILAPGLWRTHFGHVDYGAILTGAAPMFAGAIAYILTHRSGRLARCLASPPLRFLGDISYMLYLSHPYLMVLYDRHVHSWLAHPTESGLWLRMLVVLAATLLWSTLSLYLFERPVGNLRRLVLHPAAKLNTK